MSLFKNCVFTVFCSFVMVCAFIPNIYGAESKIIRFYNQASRNATDTEDFAIDAEFYNYKGTLIDVATVLEGEYVEYETVYVVEYNSDRKFLTLTNIAAPNFDVDKFGRFMYIHAFVKATDGQWEYFDRNLSEATYDKRYEEIIDIHGNKVISDEFYTERVRQPVTSFEPGQVFSPEFGDDLEPDKMYFFTTSSMDKASGKSFRLNILIVPEGTPLDNPTIKMNYASIDYAQNVPAANESSPGTVGSIVVFNGDKLDFDLQIITRNNRTYYPMREFVESIGGTVDWHNEDKTATIHYGGQSVVFKIGVPSYTKQNTQVQTDAPPFIENGATYVPIRYICEGIGLTVNWNNETNTIDIY